MTVNYATADGTAHAGTDYKAGSGTLTFSPGTVSKTISVAINPDTTAKPNETFSVVLSGATNAAIATPSGLGTIVDTIGVPPVQPVASNISSETLEGTAITLNVLASASDPAGYALSLASFTQAGHGSVVEELQVDCSYTRRPRAIWEPIRSPIR